MWPATAKWRDCNLAGMLFDLRLKDSTAECPYGSVAKAVWLTAVCRRQNDAQPKWESAKVFGRSNGSLFFGHSSGRTKEKGNGAKGKPFREANEKLSFGRNCEHSEGPDETVQCTYGQFGTTRFVVCVHNTTQTWVVCQLNITFLKKLECCLIS